MSGIWETLSTIDCSEHVKDKGGFTYLAWTWAWAMVKENYPEAEYNLEDDIVYPDGTMEVRVSVSINGLVHTMWLPVLDFRNKAIANPNAFDVNSSRMRCLVKCLAMFGLGHYIYAGESFPQPSHVLQEKYDEMVALTAQKKHWELKQFMDNNRDKIDELFNMAPQGKKSAFKADVRAVYATANNELKATLAALEDAVGNPDTEVNVTEAMAELGTIEHEYVLAGMNEILSKQVDDKIKEGL